MPKEGYRHQPYLPIGLAYLASVLEADGHEVELIDCPTLKIDYGRLRMKVASLRPKIVGVTSITPTIQSALTTVRVVKEACSEAVIILGGPHVTFTDEQILSDAPEVDIVVRGEGEQTMREIASMSAGLNRLHRVAGVTFRRDGRIIRTGDRPFIEDLDALPYPAFKHFYLEKYRVFGRKIMPIITSRGCPFQCTFCVSSRIFGRKARMRSSKNVVDEIEWLRDVHGADAFTFYDDTFTLDKKRVFKICEEMKVRKIGLPWDCQTRVDQVSREVLVKMREANCQQVFFGVESGSQKILDAVKKGTSIEQNEKAIRWAKDAGLFVAVSVIIGYPGETTDTLKQTLDFIRKTEPDDVYLCVATPYPGTELRSLVEDVGWAMSREWGLYDTMTSVFENPLLSAEEIRKLRRTFYDGFYSLIYVLRHLFKRNFYSRVMARTALNHLFWESGLFSKLRKIKRSPRQP